MYFRKFATYRRLAASYLKQGIVAVKIFCHRGHGYYDLSTTPSYCYHSEYASRESQKLSYNLAPVSGA